MPPEVQKLQHTIESVPGITDAMVDKLDVSDIPENHFNLPSYGDLPLGLCHELTATWLMDLISPKNFL